VFQLRTAPIRGWGRVEGRIKAGARRGADANGEFCIPALAILAGGGHLPEAEAPERVNELIEQHLDAGSKR